MKWSIAMLLVFLLVPVAVVGGASAAGTTAATKKCEQVPFTPNSDDTASEIRATGLTCGLARDFISDSKGRPGRHFRGFTCKSVKVEKSELPYTRYRCTGAGDVIRWHRY